MLLNSVLSMMQHRFNRGKIQDIKNIEGTAVPGSYMSNTYSEYNFLVGTGTTKPKATDYVLEQPITEGVTTTCIVNTTEGEHEDSDYLQFIGTVRNNTSEDITISECGITAISTGNKLLSPGVLIAREVPDKPIIIPSGGGTVFRVRTILAHLFQIGGAVYAD